MSTRTFWNQYNLGDCIWHCLYMRKLALCHPDIRFDFYCRPEHHVQLQPIIFDHNVKTITLHTLSEAPPEGAIACWVGPHHRGHPHWNDIILFLIDWFEHLSKVIGLENPIKRREDMLCDYPALLHDSQSMGRQWQWFDWLVINSHGMSGQFKIDDVAMEHLLRDLVGKGYKVAVTQPCGIADIFCTREWGMTVTEIGHLSLLCRNILAIATGPMWPTFNIWNQRELGERIVLCNDIHVDFGGPKLPHFGSVQACHHYLRDLKVI